ncbi:hypothetical protein [Candidatus Palauibacter sp.]
MIAATLSIVVWFVAAWLASRRRSLSEFGIEHGGVPRADGC